MIIFCQPLQLLKTITKISLLFYFYFYLAFTSKPKYIIQYIMYRYILTYFIIALTYVLIFNYILSTRKFFTKIIIITDGITMVGFQRLGTVRGYKFEQRPLPMVKDRNRSGSDPLHLYSSSSDEHVGSPKYDEPIFFLFI